MYIYELPYEQMQKLCQILDMNKAYEELAGAHMQYDPLTIDMINNESIRGGSPTKYLMSLWGQQNHTVTELFVLLGRMKHYRAMTVIKPSVEQRFHHLLRDSTAPPVMVVPPDIVHNFHNLAIDEAKPLNNIGGGVHLRAPSLTCSPSANPPQSLKTKQVQADISTVAETAGGIPKIPFKELEVATNHWHQDTFLGKGGFGTVYKGSWKCTPVAIKKIEKKDSSEQIRQSVTELHCLNTCRHDNILPLYGYSIDGPQPCVVYQYLPGGSLDRRIRNQDARKLMPWDKRLAVAIGVARGLQYLHTVGQVPIIHGDIKPPNILLDAQDTPRIGDFGLAREGPPGDMTHIKVTKIYGTRPYWPPEFYRNYKLSTKLDTYAFGVLLFEIATGLGPLNEKRKDKLLQDFICNYQGDVMDVKEDRIEGGHMEFAAMIQIGKLCVENNPKLRPDMRTALIKLSTFN